MKTNDTVEYVISGEPYIDGEYKKYLNNSGWVPANSGNIVYAFSHFI